MAIGERYELAPGAAHTMPEWIRQKAERNGDELSCIMVDLDVLVPADEAGRCYDLLRCEGFDVLQDAVDPRGHQQGRTKRLGHKRASKINHP